MFKKIFILIVCLNGFQSSTFGSMHEQSMRRHRDFGGSFGHANIYRTNFFEHPPVNEKFRHGNLAILPFLDKRDDVLKNRFFLHLVPLVPFGYVTSSAPEMDALRNHSLYVGYAFSEEFAKSLVKDLAQVDLFREVDFSMNKNGYDYYIRGTIVSTHYNVKFLSYGLSGLSSVLWLFGAPMVRIKADLVCKLELLDKHGKVIFVKQYIASPFAKTYWIYNLSGGYPYFSMLREIYREFILDVSNIK